MRRAVFFLVASTLACTGTLTAFDPPPVPAVYADAGALAWETSYDAALARATAEHKPLLVLLTRPDCPETQLLEERVLAAPLIAGSIAAYFVPVRLSIDVLNTDDLKKRAAKIDISADAAADNQQRFDLKVSIMGALARPSPSPLLAVVDAAKGLLAVDAGLLDGPAFLAFMKRGGINVQATFEPPAAAARTRIVAPYESPKGNGAYGEAPNGCGLSNLPDPVPFPGGGAYGLGGFGCVFGGTGRTEIGQIVLAGNCDPPEGRVSFTNPPLFVTWQNTGEGLQYYNPRIAPDTEDVDYRRHDNLFTVLTSPTADVVTILGNPPAHRHYNGTVRVGRHPMGVVMSWGAGTQYAFVASPRDGTIAVVYLDAKDGETCGDRIGETVFFDAATGARLEQRASADQIVDTEGRGGGQAGFDKIPGVPGPIGAAGQPLAPEDVAMLQDGSWSGSGTDPKTAYLFVSNTQGASVSVFDAAPFLSGASQSLVPLGTFAGISNPKKLHIDGGALWVTSNPGSTVTRIALDKLPAVDGAEVKTITVGTDPLYMTWIYTRGLLAVANSGDNSVSLVKDAAETARLDASNSADMKRPYGIHSWDGSRLIVSNHDADYATWWNLRMNATGDTAADLVISSSHITTGTGVTAIDGDYIP